MKKDTRKKVLFGLGVFYALFGRYGTTAYKLRFKLRSLVPVAFGGDTVTLMLTFSVKNPTVSSVYIRGFAGNVYINGAHAASVDTWINKRIAGGNVVTDFQIPIVVNYLELASELLNQINNGGTITNAAITFNGKLGIGTGSLTIPFKGTYNL